MKSTYLSGFDEENYYQKLGAFRGSLPGGFMVSLFIRDLNPFFAAVDDEGAIELVFRGLCSNFQSDEAATRGWALSVVSQFPDTLFFQLLYGEADGTPTGGPLFELQQGAIASQRSMLVHMFFGVNAQALDPDFPSILFFVNGAPMINFTIEAGYAPADASNPFLLGANTTLFGGGKPPIIGAVDYGIAGYAYFDGLEDNVVGSDRGLKAAADLVAEHWNAVQAAEDMVAVGPITDVFSTRRGLPEVADTWTASTGDVVLERAGTEGLFVEASKPRFWSGQQPPP